MFANKSRFPNSVYFVSLNVPNKWCTTYTFFVRATQNEQIYTMNISQQHRFNVWHFVRSIFFPQCRAEKKQTISRK